MHHDTSKHRRLGGQLLLTGVAFGGVGALLVLVGSNGSANVETTCNAPPAAPGEIAKSIDTTLGCDAADGTALNPVTGWMTVHMPAGISTATGLDVFEANVKGGDHPYWAGGYTVSFPTVSGGTATGATYTVADGSARYPDPPSITPHPLTFTSTTAGGTVQAQYRVVFSGSAPAAMADMASMTNNLFVWFGDGSPKTQARTVSVKPFEPGGPTPTPTTTSTSTTSTSTSPTSTTSTSTTSISTTSTSTSATSTSTSTTSTRSASTTSTSTATTTSTPEGPTPIPTPTPAASPTPAAGVQSTSTPATGAGVGSWVGLGLALGGLALTGIGGTLRTRR